jgi:hypothetical protein
MPNRHVDTGRYLLWWAQDRCTMRNEEPVKFFKGIDKKRRVSLPELPECLICPTDNKYITHDSEFKPCPGMLNRLTALVPVRDS